MIDVLIRWENIMIFLTLKGPLARKMDIKQKQTCKNTKEHQDYKDTLIFQCSWHELLIPWIMKQNF